MDLKRAAAMLERRRVSASVHEIQDLYSALQELVPGGATSSLPQRANYTLIIILVIKSLLQTEYTDFDILNFSLKQ